MKPLLAKIARKISLVLIIPLVLWLGFVCFIFGAILGDEER
jgi:hypothetical protein